MSLVHNPSSGDASPPAELLLAMLGEAGYQVRYRSTEEAWQEALQWPVDFVVVAGGDGTVAKVMGELVGRSLPLAILPFGTANNVAKALGITGDGDALVLAREWKSGPLRAFDVWGLEVGGQRQAFVESMGGGFLGRPMQESSALKPPTLILGNEIDRGLHLMRSAVSEAPEARWEVQLDGEDLSGDFIGVEALNIRSVGPNLPLAPGADSGDGLIDLVLVRGSHRALLERRLSALARARTPEPLELEVRRGRELRLRPPADIAFHLDGAPWKPSAGSDAGTLELDIALAGRIDVLAPVPD